MGLAAAVVYCDNETRLRYQGVDACTKAGLNIVNKIVFLESFLQL
jgi:hypothetical protein